MAVTTATIDALGKETREINKEIRRLISEGFKEITILNPGSKHNLAVAIIDPASSWARDHGFEPASPEKYGLPAGISVRDVTLIFEGSVGYYCAGLIDGPTVVIRGRAGWALAENMMGGTVICEKAAGSSLGSSLRAGTLVAKGNAGGRTGISQKGGTVVVGGNSGFNTGFMMQQGRMIICGNVGRGVGDSMYDGEIFVGGAIGSQGIDTKVVDPSAEDVREIEALLATHGLDGRREWKKIVAGKMLYNYDVLEPLERKIAL